MGVQGITSFMEGDGNILKNVHFRNSKLIIDGCNLYYLLYFNSHFSQSHGGDYDSFKFQIEKFFQVLQECNIDPFVVLDGGSDGSDKKLETLKQRAQSKINTAKILSNGLQEKGGVLPTLVNQVFKQVLLSLNVPMAQVFYEADQEIASLAQMWNCPVLSNDSDFYIFDLKAGFLPISHFQWNKMAVTHGSQKRYISCKRYTTTSFCRYVHINRQLLPVFAALLGNDNVKMHTMGIFLRWEDYSSMTGRFARIDGLLKWLSSFQGQQEALDSVLKLIDRDYNRQKKYIANSLLSLGIEEYHLSSSCLERFFNTGVGPGSSRLPEPLRVFPEWMLLPFMQGRLPSCMVDVLLKRRRIMGTQVEDFQMPSGNIISRPLRQVFYGLLLGGRMEDQSSQRSPVEYVEEYDREGTDLTSSMVEAVLPRSADQLQLDTLAQVPHVVRLELLLETISVSQSSLSGVPPHLRLPVAVTCYWLRHAHPQPDQPLLQALLLGLLFGELHRQRQSQRVRRPENLLFERLRGEIQKGAKGLDLVVSHAYSQWQSCLRDGIHLNQLLSVPLAEPQCAWLYRGTVVHQLEAKLRGPMTPESLLEGSCSFKQLYRAMLDAIHKSQTDIVITKASRAIPSSLKMPQDDLAARLRMLELETEEEGDEGGSTAKPENDLGWTLVTVRTRHKAKERLNRSRNPEFSRKQERIGWD
ncbi:hypothetical protein UPYG_G00155420 [Umbra pygmaea]|uniref:XPG N-terminal domain-containing protein n=1 Tax=Umbra pygmaea TaxID=75934 RepID=A0ABD0XMW6_UMBPY